MTCQSFNFRQREWKIIFFVRDHILRYFFALKAKGWVCPASESTWLWLCQVIGAQMKGINSKFVGVTLPFTLCLQLTNIIWPLSLHLDMRLGPLYLIFTTWLYLRKDVETIHDYIDRGLETLDSLKWKQVFGQRKSKNVSRAASSSYCPVHQFEHLQVHRVKTGRTLFLTPAGFLPPFPFARALSTTLCRCIPSTFCRVLS